MYPKSLCGRNLRGVPFQRGTIESVGAFVLLIGCFLWGCDKAPTGGRPTPATKQSFPTLAEDRSLTVRRFVERGVPDSSRAWGPEDYAKAIEILRTISNEDVLKLPRVDSPVSGELMRRLVSPTNLDVLKDKSSSIGRRMALVNGFTTSCKALLMLYLNPESRGIHFDRELVVVVIHQERINRIMMSLALEILDTLSPEEVRSPVRRQGWEQMWNGFAMSISSQMEMISERSHYRDPERLALAKSVGETLSGFFDYLPDSNRRELPGRLGQLVREESDSDVRRALTELEDITTSPHLDPLKGPPKSEFQPTPTSPPTVPPGARVLKTQAGTPKGDGWYSGESSDEAMFVDFPQPYNEISVEWNANDPGATSSGRMVTLGARTPGGATFSLITVIRLDGKPLDPDALDRQVEEFKRKGDLRKLTPVMLGTLTGKEIELWNRQSESRCRLFVRGGQQFMLIVEVPFGQESVLREDGDRF